MVQDVSEFLSLLDFSELQSVLMEEGFFRYIFPFLLLYALLSAALPNLRLFQDKNGQPRKAVVVVISLIVSLTGTVFETSSGWNVGRLMEVMFPNISTLTILILCLYVVGSVLNKNFFTSLFRKDISAYVFFAVGIIGLGAIIYYLGIAMGFWDLDPLDPQSYWNVVLAVAFLVMGVVFLLIGLYGWGVILLSVVGIFVYSSGNESILEYFIDPFIFIFIIIVLLLSWMGQGTRDEERRKLEQTIRDQETTLQQYDPQGQSRIKDIVEEGLKRNKAKRDRYK